MVEIEFEGDKFMAYVQPHVTTFYKEVDPPASTAVTPMHDGFAGKFINLSKEKMLLFWEPYEGAKDPSLMRVMPPFFGGGSATFPTHRFYFSTEEDPHTPVKRFIVQQYPESLYVYDPYHVEGDEEQTEQNLSILTEEERAKYDAFRKTLRFNKVYQNVTGRQYLVNYPRPRPVHFMWPADYLNQTHWVTTRETHVTKLPPPEKLQPIKERGTKRVITNEDPVLLQEYRDETSDVFNMTLKVLSCAPRVYEIPGFLSQVEVDHIMELALGEDLSLSSTGDGDEEEVDIDAKKITTTRTSLNSWLPREKSPIVDIIYRRAADLMRIDEALLRSRSDGEYPNLKTKKSIAESLQLVHYEDGQEYTAHHDFGYNAVDDEFQQARFATLLFYLNGGMTGGATSFPRWVNAETFRGLKAVPEAGKAVLFYSQLPDGNMDDFSQHAAEPVTEGEKWLINLWTHDPIYEV
jgi:prolyl 4-hydroxylase